MKGAAHPTTAKSLGTPRPRPTARTRQSHEMQRGTRRQRRSECNGQQYRSVCSPRRHRHLTLLCQRGLHEHGEKPGHRSDHDEKGRIFYESGQGLFRRLLTYPLVCRVPCSHTVQPLVDLQRPPTKVPLASARRQNQKYRSFTRITSPGWTTVVFSPRASTVCPSTVRVIV
jgi:hypothetical protein